MEAPRVPPAPPCLLVLFGATGDLTRRLLMPALINMTRAGLLDEKFRILGIGIEPGDDAMLRERLASFHPEKGGEGDTERGAAWTQLSERIHYVQGDFTQDAIYERVKQEVGDGNAAFYLATPPALFAPIAAKLGAHGLTDEAKGFRRIAIEKPFGHDLQSARALNAALLESAAESQIYRIDHFLGKETVQNIMTARFANMMIEGLWSSDKIDHVQITAAETVGIGTRGAFYDVTGALRDMVPNHLFQLLAMIAMEPPTSFDAESIRTEKGKVLKAIRHYSVEEARDNGVRGQFTAGTAEGAAVPAYTETPHVAADSRTETYVALKLLVDTWRWAGVPFYLRTGKLLAARDTEIVVTFKPVPFAQFASIPAEHRPPPNRLVIQVQPNEGLSMQISIKRPGLVVEAVPVALDFRYAAMFDISGLTGYETLLYDLFVGDQTLFQRADGIEAGWAAVQPFLDAWADAPAPDPYAPGSSGPEAADALLARDGRQWCPVGAARCP
ncbi:glucose-6-phosphate dehydrogenase [Sphingomonas morindae]|uniref:Glucose-6-phosphate 1-dehydrogenase n=1 Tax=Sphingomonas morindae TaxID=1541170 RepID=A0ABY4XA30_9SPHN|nr:glucose-6-phosphate dehydrogenase [Sphingomonas morindae]USI73810.1 glucose-6-phosphate dehydrogenase [Sphingomonas morindae]